MNKAQFLAERQRPGEIYAGLILGKNGQPDYHLFLLPAKPKTPKNDWDTSMSWAASVGGALPTPPEQSLLHANCKEHFENDWYWSSEQYARNDVYAWMQGFYGGGQYGNHKSNEYRARAVRRELVIQ